MRVTQKSLCKENNPCQNVLAGVACSKSGLLGQPHKQDTLQHCLQIHIVAFKKR